MRAKNRRSVDRVRIFENHSVLRMHAPIQVLNRSFARLNVRVWTLRYKQASMGEMKSRNSHITTEPGENVWSPHDVPDQAP